MSFWPTLRQDLDLMPGPNMPDGQPSWTLHDPARNQFFRIDWPTLEVLQRWDLADAALIASDISEQTTLKLDAEDVLSVVQNMLQHQLLQTTDPMSTQRMVSLWQKRQGTPLKWLLHHYLFFRVPLWRPDAWLSRYLPVARLFASKAFALATLLALLFGITQVARRWDVFSASLVDTFNLEGLMAYGAALFVVKLLHEMGHAFTAKHHGCRVPTMGVAFLVMWPVAYTDTNETWRLTRRWDRLRVAIAGIHTELVIAAWSTFAWALLPNGALQNAAFVLATTSWVATLAINASPFMRFDGYFILMDALDMPNLHGRSFALARWKLREWLFGLGDEKPEHFTPGKEFALIAFAWATWLYRLVLFIGIAILVYQYFFKALGVILFAVEVIWFIFWPIRSEIQVWAQRWSDIRKGSRGRRTTWALMLLAGLLSVPWPGRVSVSAVMQAPESWTVFAPSGARIESLPVRHGEKVDSGAALLVLQMPDLQGREEAVRVRLHQQQWAASAAGFDEEMRKRWRVSEQVLSTTQAEWRGLQAERSQFEPIAPFAGRFHWSDPDLRPGQWVGKREALGQLVQGTGRWRVETWLDESEVARIRVGNYAFFSIDSATGPVVSLQVVDIDSDAARALPRKELVSQFGGHLLAREKNGAWVPERAVYRVALESEIEVPEFIGQSWRGQLVIHGEWSSPIARYVREVIAVLIRETGF